jgi:hypothetical protein
MESQRRSARNVEVWTKRVNGAATLALFGTVLGSAWAAGRVYGKWTKDINVLTAPRARVVKFRTDYRSKRTNALEMGGLLGAMVVETVVAGRASRPPVDRQVVDSAYRAAMSRLASEKRARKSGGPSTSTSTPIAKNSRKA